MRRSVWQRIRTVWITLGLGATAIFAVWSLLAYRPSTTAREALHVDATLQVVQSNHLIGILPADPKKTGSGGLLFFPGALVDPLAYAPLIRAVADAGFDAFILKLPRRGAFGGADDPGLYARADSVIQQSGRIGSWVIAGHSRGAVVASTMAARQQSEVAGLILIGTSHPRDVNLSGLRIPVTKIVGTQDGLATPAKVEANASLLPPTTQWKWVEGGNHSQFGWYGFQPGDRWAQITREDQQAQMIRAVIAALHDAAAASTT